MPGYTPLFNDIVTSSIWDEDSDTRVVWITMMALADKNGFVAGSIPGLARLAKVPIEICKGALDKFQAPDLYSRSKKNEGRRIVVTDGGWILLNYVEHREKAKLRNAEYYRNWRKNSKNGKREGKSATVAQRCATSFEVAPDAIENEGETQKINQKAQHCATEAQQKRNVQQTTNNKQQTTNINNINNNNISKSIEGGLKTDVVVSDPSQKSVVGCLSDITKKRDYFIRRIGEIYPLITKREAHTLAKMVRRMEIFAQTDKGGKSGKVFHDALQIIHKSTGPDIKNHIGYIVGSIKNLIE